MFGKEAPVLPRRTWRLTRQPNARATVADKFVHHPPGHDLERIVFLGKYYGTRSLSAFQRTHNFQNGLKLGIGAAFDRARAEREVFYTCVVNRIKISSGSWLGEKSFDITTRPLSDIAYRGAVAVQRRFFPRALVVRQSARPARRRARRNSRRAREKSAAD
jgi:hypothetical protein